MTCMKKEELKLLAQATAIVDKLLPPIAKKGLLDAATPSFKGIDLGKAEVTVTSIMLGQEAKSFWMDEFKGDTGLMMLSKASKQLYSDFYDSQWKQINNPENYYQDFHTRTREEITPAFKEKCKTIFQRAFDIIKDERFWCQGSLAREVRIAKYELISFNYDLNAPIEVKSSREVGYQLCSIGAILNADGADAKELTRQQNLHPSNHFNYVVQTLPKYMGGDVAKFNDNMGHKYVVQAWENCGKAMGWLSVNKTSPSIQSL